MKNIIITLAASCLYMFSSAQFSVLVNGKPVKAGDVLSIQEMQLMEVSFKPVKKAPEYTVGRSTLFVEFANTEGRELIEYDYQVEGYTAIGNFLYPKEKVVYKIWDKDSKTDMKVTSSMGLTTFQRDYSRDIANRKLKVTFNLTFEEAITYDSYGKALVLIEPFTFYLDVWEKSNTIEMPKLALKYTYPGSGDYKDVDIREWDSKTVGLTDADYCRVLFKDNHNFSVYLTTYTFNGAQDSELAAMKTHLENYLVYYANRCNGKKINKDMPVPDGSRSWGELTGFNERNVLAGLDRKNNPDFASVKMVESFSSGIFSGLRFRGISKSYECTSTSVLLATVEGPADPKKQAVTGATVMYMLKHPTATNKLIIFYAHTNSDESSTESGLDKISGLMEQFLSNLQ